MKTSIPVLITYISENVTIFNIYVIQMVIKLAISIINSDKFIGSYDDLYIEVTFWDTRYIGEERAYERGGGTSHFILHKCVTYFVSDSSCSFLFFFWYVMCICLCFSFMLI